MNASGQFSNPNISNPNQQAFPSQIGMFNSGYIPGPNIINPPNPLDQLNPYNRNIPADLNYSVPAGIRGSQMPFLSGSINPSINPYASQVPGPSMGPSIGVPGPNMGVPGPNMGVPGPNIGQSINPFDPNTNFLQQNIYNNPMMNPTANLQGMENMANNTVINDPDLRINQFFKERLEEREKMKEQTKEIYKRLNDKRFFRRNRC